MTTIQRFRREPLTKRTVEIASRKAEAFRSRGTTGGAKASPVPIGRWAALRLFATAAFAGAHRQSGRHSLAEDVVGTGAAIYMGCYGFWKGPQAIADFQRAERDVRIQRATRQLSEILDDGEIVMGARNVGLDIRRDGDTLSVLATGDSRYDSEADAIVLTTFSIAAIAATAPHNAKEVVRHMIQKWYAIPDRQRATGYLVQLRHRFPEITVRVTTDESVAPHRRAHGLGISIVFPQPEDGAPPLTVDFSERVDGRVDTNYPQIVRELDHLFAPGVHRSDFHHHVSVTPKGWHVADRSGVLTHDTTSLSEAENWYAALPSRLMEQPMLAPYADMIAAVDLRIGHRMDGWSMPGVSVATADLDRLCVHLKQLRVIWEQLRDSGSTLRSGERPAPDAYFTSDGMWSKVETYFAVTGRDGSRRDFLSLASLVEAFPPRS